MSSSAFREWQRMRRPFPTARKRVSLSSAISNEAISVLLLRRMQSATSATCRWEANAYAGFHEDFATVNPYLGSDGVKPFIKVCKEEKKGIFVLVKTSNPSSREFQDRSSTDVRCMSGSARQLPRGAGEHMGDDYSYVGAVVGATYPEMGKVLRKVMPKSYILVPGYGAQGGKGKDSFTSSMRTDWVQS